MFHSRIVNNKLNQLHERYMCLIYGDKTTSFEEVFEQDKSVSILSRKLQMFATEMFKLYRNMSPPISVNYLVGVISDIIYELILILQCKICISWKQKYFLPIIIY